jgi:pimeloyl-ACP methyl ester carboxylesterase
MKVMSVVGLLAIAIALALVLAGIWLWTPDRDRAELEARYAKAPSDFVDVAGMRMHVRDNGRAGVPVVILLHGLGASLHTWEAWAQALSAEYRVVRVDLPGAGLTGSDPSGDYSDGRGVAVLRELMDTLGVAQATLAGHSLGGRLAWRFAAEHPERLAKLVLVAPDGFASPGFEYGKKAEIPTLVKLMRYVLPKPMLRMQLTPAYADPAALNDDLVTRYYELMLAPTVRAAMIARMEQTMLTDPIPILAGIETPTLLIWGEKDRMIPVSNAADYLRAMPDATLVKLPDAGHLPHEEAPADSLPALRVFLEH